MNDTRFVTDSHVGFPVISQAREDGPGQLDWAEGLLSRQETDPTDETDQTIDQIIGNQVGGVRLDSELEARLALLPPGIRERILRTLHSPDRPQLDPPPTVGSEMIRLEGLRTTDCNNSNRFIRSGQADDGSRQARSHDLGDIELPGLQTDPNYDRLPGVIVIGGNDGDVQASGATQTETGVTLHDVRLITILDLPNDQEASDIVQEIVYDAYGSIQSEIFRPTRERPVPSPIATPMVQQPSGIDDLRYPSPSSAPRSDSRAWEDGSIVDNPVIARSNRRLIRLSHVDTPWFEQVIANMMSPTCPGCVQVAIRLHERMADEMDFQEIAQSIMRLLGRRGSLCDDASCPRQTEPRSQRATASSDPNSGTNPVRTAGAFDYMRDAPSPEGPIGLNCSSCGEFLESEDDVFNHWRRNDGHELFIDADGHAFQQDMDELRPRPEADRPQAPPEPRGIERIRQEARHQRRVERGRDTMDAATLRRKFQADEPSTKDLVEKLMGWLNDPKPTRQPRIERQPQMTPAGNLRLESGSNPGSIRLAYDEEQDYSLFQPLMEDADIVRMVLGRAAQTGEPISHRIRELAIRAGLATEGDFRTINYNINDRRYPRHVEDQKYRYTGTLESPGEPFTMAAPNTRFVRLAHCGSCPGDPCPKCKGSGNYVGGHFTEENPGRCYACGGSGRIPQDRTAMTKTAGLTDILDRIRAWLADVNDPRLQRAKLAELLKDTNIARELQQALEQRMSGWTDEPDRTAQVDEHPRIPSSEGCEYRCLTCGNWLARPMEVMGHWELFDEGHSMFVNRRGEAFHQTVEGLQRRSDADTEQPIPDEGDQHLASNCPRFVRTALDEDFVPKEDFLPRTDPKTKVPTPTPRRRSTEVKIDSAAPGRRQQKREERRENGWERLVHQFTDPKADLSKVAPIIPDLRQYFETHPAAKNQAGMQVALQTTFGKIPFPNARDKMRAIGDNLGLTYNGLALASNPYGQVRTAGDPVEPEDSTYFDPDGDADWINDLLLRQKGNPIDESIDLPIDQPISLPEAQRDNPIDPSTGLPIDKSTNRSVELPMQGGGSPRFVPANPDDYSPGTIHIGPVALRPIDQEPMPSTEQVTRDMDLRRQLQLDQGAVDPRTLDEFRRAPVDIPSALSGLHQDRRIRREPWEQGASSNTRFTKLALLGRGRNTIRRLEEVIRERLDAAIPTTDPETDDLPVLDQLRRYRRPDPRSTRDLPARDLTR